MRSEQILNLGDVLTVVRPLRGLLNRLSGLKNIFDISFICFYPLLWASLCFYHYFLKAVGVAFSKMISPPGSKGLSMYIIS